MEVFNTLYRYSISKKNFSDFVDFFTHYLEYRIKIKALQDLKTYHMKNRLNQFFRLKFILEIQKSSLSFQKFIKSRDFLIQLNDSLKNHYLRISFNKILRESLNTIDDVRKNNLFELIKRGTVSNYLNVFDLNKNSRLLAGLNNDNIFNYYYDFVKNLKKPNNLKIVINCINLTIKPQIKEISMPFSFNFHSPEKSRKKDDFEEDVVNISRHNKTCAKEEDFDISHSQFSVGKSFQFTKLKKHFQIASKKLIQGSEYEKSIMLRDEYNDEF